MPRPRGKATKACQTDSVCLTEDQVQHIVSQQISHLKEAIQKLQSDVKDLKSINDKLSKDNETLNYLQQASDANLEQLQENFDLFEEVNSKLQQEIYRCQDEKEANFNKQHKKIDDIEQTQKLINLRVAGMEEQEDEDVQGKMISLAQQLKTTLEPRDILDVRRMGPPKAGKTRDILIKFSSQRKRDILYQNRKMLHHSTSTPVYLNEDLTQHRSQLFYEARKLRKQGRIFGAWSQQGNILVKVNELSQPQAVSNRSEIMKLIEDPSNSTLTADITNSLSDSDILDDGEDTQ